MHSCLIGSSRLKYIFPFLGFHKEQQSWKVIGWFTNQHSHQTLAHNKLITLASSLCLHSVQNSYFGAEVQIGCCSEISQGSSHSLPSTCNFTSTIPLFGQVLFVPRGRTTMAQTRAFSTIGPPLECHPSLSLINLAFCISSASFKICHQNEWTSAGTSIPWGEWSRNLYQSQFRVEK